MKTRNTLAGALFTLSVIVVVAYNCASNNPSKDAKTNTDQQLAYKDSAFLNHRDSVPSQQQYDHPLFVLSHDYPREAKAIVDPPWQKALKGKPISALNVFAYMDSLKSYIAPNVLPFFTDNANWTAAKNGWFHEPWLGLEREAILGTYQGNPNPAGMFTTLHENEAGYVLVLYDSTAAYTVGQIWGETGQKVNLLNDATQFKEGSVIVKLAFSNINYPQWSVMNGAQTFSIYDTVPTTADRRRGYQVRQVSFFQMDVVVKDSKTAPKTGWIYSTFVYDKDAKGTFWQKMVPLGAMWGNDPDIISPIAPPYPPLNETVINTKAPFYSKETLGWGGRLSGPNDGAVAQGAINMKNDSVYKNLPMSSCMSCHSPAQDEFKSFLLPGKFTQKGLVVYPPGGPEWMRWFRDDYGNVPFDSGEVAMDYDMVMAFKSVPAFNKAKSSGQNKLATSAVQDFTQLRRFNLKNKISH